ncbi:hypothetical protein [Mycobacteroides abscessus]
MRAFDRYNFDISHDPNRTISFDVGTATKDAAKMAFDQLENLIKLIVQSLPVVGDVIQVIKDLTGIDLMNLSDLLNGKWLSLDKVLGALQGIDLANPGAVLAKILELAGKALGFNGVIPVSWLADVVQDLINAAGEFLNADSVTDNPYFDWDSVVPGWLSGGSIRATGNGTQQVLRSEPFDVVEGQTLNLRSAVMWTGVAADAGTNPIKVGFTPFDSSGSPMADVIRGSLQPTAADGSWQWIPADPWNVPAGVAKVSHLLMVDSGATAGVIRFSNARSWMTNLAGQDLIKDLPADLADLAAGIADTVVQLASKLAQGDFEGFLAALMNGGATSNSAIRNKFQFLDAAGKFDATKLLGLIAQAQVDGLATIQTIINQILDILNGIIVTPVNSLVQGVKDWFGLNQNKTQALNSSGQLAGTAITGAIAEAQTGLDAVRDAIASGLGAIGSGFTNLQAQNQAIQVAQIAAQAAAAAAAANAQLAKSQGQQNAAGGGLNYTTVFGGPDGAALPAEFTGSDLKVRGNNGYAGIAASKSDGTYVVTCNKQCSTDDQSLAVVLGDQGGSPNAPEYHLFHSDSGYAAGACLKIDNGNATIGSYTRSGATITFTPFSGGAWSGTLGQGSLVEVHNVGTTWTLAVNGNTVLSVTSSAVTFGASTRYGGGVVMVRATVNLGWFQGTVTYDSFRVASITLSDYIDPVYLGSGATMARTSATNVTIATGTTVLPNSFYSVVQSATPDIACNLTNGTMTVSLSGWYLAKLSTKSNIFTNSTNSAGQATPAIFINSTTVVTKLGLPQQYSRSNSSDGSVDLTIPVLSLSDSFVVYLNAGDVVRGGQVLGSNATTRQVTGDSAGTATYLSLSLLNRSQI